MSCDLLGPLPVIVRQSPFGTCRSRVGMPAVKIMDSRAISQVDIGFSPGL